MKKRIFICDKCFIESDKYMWQVAIYKPKPDGSFSKSIDLCEECKNKLITWAYTK